MPPPLTPIKEEPVDDDVIFERQIFPQRQTVDDPSSDNELQNRWNLRTRGKSIKPVLSRAAPTTVKRRGASLFFTVKPDPDAVDEAPIDAKKIKHTRRSLDSAPRKNTTYKKKPGPSGRHYAISRILAENGNKYLVAWQGYNGSESQWTPKQSLQGCERIIADWKEKENGLKAIMENIKNDPWYNAQKKPQTFVRRHVSEILPLSDQEWEKIRSDPKTNLLQWKLLGYWQIKGVELDWLQALNPTSVKGIPPVYLESMYRRQDPPAAFKYLTQYFLTDEAAKLEGLKITKPHLCIYGDLKKACRVCKYANYVLVKQKAGSPMKLVLPDNPDVSRSHALLVCSPNNCVCPGGWKNCQSWLQDNPRTVPLMVFGDRRYGNYGVRTLRDIKKGQIIGEYIGEVCTEEETKDRFTSYLLCCYSKYVVDTTNMGNETRFIGHSCKPNLISLPVFVRGFDMTLQLRSIFVAMRDVLAGEDLNFDYHPRGQRPKKGYGKCCCNQDNCRGWL